MYEGKAKGSRLIIFEDGTLYHIDLKRSDNIPTNVFLVGAAERVEKIAGFFDKVLFRHQNRARPEFSLVAGEYKGVPMAAMSCGIGVDNIEITLTELHALFEYDHTKDEWTKNPPKVNIIRIGTCGTPLPEIELGSVVVSRYALGLDNLGAYYKTPRHDKIASSIEKAFLKTAVGKVNPLSYVSPASPVVVDAIENTARRLGENKIFSGITTASPGFFAPEGRAVGRIKTAISFDEFLKEMTSFEAEGVKIVNHEMESSALFRIGHEILGYRVGAICVVLDNLSTDEMIDAKQAGLRMEKCIKIALESMVELAEADS